MNFDFKSARHWAQALIREAVGEGGGRISDDLYQCGKDAAQAQGLFL